jgi:hypothetical protein
MRPYTILALISLAAAALPIVTSPDVQGLFLCLVSLIMAGIFFLIGYRPATAK